MILSFVPSDRTHGAMTRKSWFVVQQLTSRTKRLMCNVF